MKRTLRPFFAICLVLVGVLSLVWFSRRSDAKEAVAWRTNFSAAQSEARSTHKPVFIYFTATWCGPCQEMKRTTWADARVGAALGEYVPVKIDVDQNQELAGKYGVDGIPTYALLDDEGRPLKAGSGFVTSDAFLDWLHAAAPASAPVSFTPNP